MNDVYNRTTTNEQTIICGDSVNEIKKIESTSIDLILSDIPYGISYNSWDTLHNNKNSALLGVSPSQENNRVFKTRGKPLNGWSAVDKQIPYEYYKWCSLWAPDWYRVLNSGGSCFIFAGRRMMHRCICAMEDAGFIFKDMIAWQKEIAVYRAQNVKSVFERRKDINNSEKWDGWKIGNLRPLFEPILWFMKPYPIGCTLTDNILKHSLGGYNERFIKENPLENKGIEICANVIRCKVTKEDRGLHPTQKPVLLMEYFIGLTTMESQVVLDPFCGSGSTLVAAKNLGRKYIGIERDVHYYTIAVDRLNNLGD